MVIAPISRSTDTSHPSNSTVFSKFRSNETTRYLTSVSLAGVIRDSAGSNYLNYPNQCIVINGIVYIVTMYDSALVIVNATDPANMTEISHTQDPIYLKSPRDVAVTNDTNYCYMITYESNSHLTMWNISNKTTPHRVNQTVFNSEIGMSCIMDASNNYLYVCTKQEVRIVNITDKVHHQMTVMSTFHTGMGSSRQIWLATPYKNTVYVSNLGTGNTNGYGDFVYNITNKASPQYIQTLNASFKTDLGCPIYTYHGFDYFIYVARYVVNNNYYRGYIECWNVSTDPNNPVFMWAKDTLGADGSKDNFSQGGIAIKNGYIFIGQANQNNTNKKVGINVWNATHIESKPTFMFHFGTGDAPYYMKIMHELEFDRNGNDTTVFGLSQNSDSLVAIHLIWSDNPPSAPSITGPSTGKPGTSYTYTFLATDKEGHNISYEINWGDGTIDDWYGPVASNISITRTHTWSAKGTYEIQARAKDSLGAIGNWGSLSVIMPLVYEPPHHRFLNRLLDRFPHLFPLLRSFLNRWNRAH